MPVGTSRGRQNKMGGKVRCLGAGRLAGWCRLVQAGRHSIGRTVVPSCDSFRKGKCGMTPASGMLCRSLELVISFSARQGWLAVVPCVYCVVLSLCCGLATARYQRCTVLVGIDRACSLLPATDARLLSIRGWLALLAGPAGLASLAGSLAPLVTCRFFSILRAWRCVRSRCRTDRMGAV